MLPGCLNSHSQKVETFNATTITYDQNTYPVVILGGGIGGLTAALYCKQASIPCLVVEGPKPGGALTQSHSVRNWPGQKDAPGLIIVDNIREQVKNSIVDITQEKVIEVDFNQWPRIVRLQNLQDSSIIRTVRALTVVVAMGSEPNYLGVPGESSLWGKGVTNCAVCDGSLYQGKEVVVVGGGDSAVVEADYLADIAKTVTILVRKDFFKAKDTQALKKVLARSNVKVLFDTHITTINGDGTHVTNIEVENTKSNQKLTLAIDGVFLAIGSRPNSSLFKNKLAMDDKGFIVRKDYQETSISGVYVAGDICDPEFVQAITAAGDGCRSALQAIRFLKKVGFETSMLKQKMEQVKPDVVAQDTVKKERELLQELTTAQVPEILSEKDFERLVINAQQPVVIDLFGRLCIPCKNMMPVIDSLAEELAGKISFVKLNIANKAFNVQKALARLGGQEVQSVPTFIVVRNGKEVGRMEGELDKTEFRNNLVALQNPQ